MKIKDVKIGDGFIYNGHNYTKLNDNNLCIIDDYDDGFMKCMFDPIDNDFNESLIRFYLNSSKFINKLNIDVSDILFIDGDFLTLLSNEEYDECQEIIKSYKTFWWLRSGNPYFPYEACFVDFYDCRLSGNVDYRYGVRPVLKLKPDVIVKGVNNEI